MIRLDAGNVLLKPAQRRHLMASLRRSLRLGERLGNFLLTITMQRIGKQYQLLATVSDRLGQFECRFRSRDVGNAMRDMTRFITQRLHDQCLQQLTLA
ncbi:MAG TPA: hypothetical protein VFE58_16100 [Tepidisphaeraceae bacterium]|jgi:hypothetical protein|nr:hypothetical protein [Tepidisphaeraceae bacterium]